MENLTVTILFYVFAALSVISAFLVITSRHPVRAVVALVFTFIFAACTWLLLEVEYLALLLVVVYIGAVMVLFMFVIMMLDINVEFNRAGFVKHWPVAFVVTVLVIALLELSEFKCSQIQQICPAAIFRMSSYRTIMQN